MDLSFVRGCGLVAIIGILATTIHPAAARQITVTIEGAVKVPGTFQVEEGTSAFEFVKQAQPLKGTNFFTIDRQVITPTRWADQTGNVHLHTAPPPAVPGDPAQTKFDQKFDAETPPRGTEPPPLRASISMSLQQQPPFARDVPLQDRDHIRVQAPAQAAGTVFANIRLLSEKAFVAERVADHWEFWFQPSVGIESLSGEFNLPVNDE